MAIHVQVTLDCRDPHALAAFWAAALHYDVEDHHDLVSELLAAGAIDDAATVVVDSQRRFVDVAACRDPAEVGPRLFFQKVPEPKKVKNRMHLDLHVGSDQVEPESARVEALGAQRLWFSDDRGGPTWTMADVEGNEFCVD